MARALAAQLEISGLCGIEEDDRLGGERAVLGCAEGEHVDPCTPRDLARVAAEKGERIREARAIEVHFEPAAVCGFADRGDLSRAIARAELGCLSERHGGR